MTIGDMWQDFKQQLWNHRWPYPHPMQWLPEGMRDRIIFNRYPCLPRIMFSFYVSGEPINTADLGAAIDLAHRVAPTSPYLDFLHQLKESA